MSLTQKVAFNTIIQIVGKIITTAISLVLIAAITRYLGVSGYGDYTTIFAYVGFWSVLADFGFFWILVREISKPRSHLQKLFNNIVTLRVLIGLAIFALAFLVGLLIPSYPLVVKLGIGVCAAGWFWISLNSTYVGVFQSKLKMQYSVIGDILGRLVILGLVLMFIAQNYSLHTIIWAYFIGNLVNLLASMFFARPFVCFRPEFDGKLWKQVFLKALPMALVIIFGVLYFKIDTVMLSLFKSSTDVGIYGAPFKILEILLLIPGIFMGNVFPIITRYHETSDQRITSAMQKSFDFLVIIAIPLVFGTLVLAPQIIKFVAGEQFVITTTIDDIFGRTASSPMVLKILIITVAIYYISQLFTNAIIAIGRQKELVKPYIIITIVNVVLNLFFIPRYSYIGAAFVTIITAILVLYFSKKIFSQVHPIKFSCQILLRVLITSIIMALAIFFIKVNLLISIILAIVIYAGGLYLFGGIKKEYILTIFKRQ